MWTHGPRLPAVELPPENSVVTFASLLPTQTIPSQRRVQIRLANGGGIHAARCIVSGDFLELVRLGVRSSSDPLVVDSVALLDAVLKRELPEGVCWRRYNFDGYGQKPDGHAFDGTGEGRVWPLLSGDRGHYELSAGRDPMPFISSIERFPNAGGLLPEQL